MTITLRNTKGSPLTHNELDGNFTDLDARTESGWNDLVSELYGRGAASPTVTQYRDGIYLYEFMDAQDLDVYANFHVKHDYKVGSSYLYPHLHFVTTSNSGGVVRLEFEYTWARRHDSTGQTAFPATNTLTLDFTIPSNSAHTHFVAEMPEGQGIPGGTIETDTLILMRIGRKATHPNDTFPDSIWGIAVDLHYECSQFATPLRAPPFY